MYVVVGCHGCPNRAVTKSRGHLGCGLLEVTGKREGQYPDTLNGSNFPSDSTDVMQYQSAF